MASVTPSSDPQRAPQRAPRRRRDLGRLAARLLCFVFALVGMIPLGGGLLLRSDPVHHWAARETARLLEKHLGLEATYSLELSLWPFRVAVTELVVPATDGGGPALTARSVAVRPRFFSLLAGRLDVGDIEIDGLRARLVLREGQLVNLRYSVPDTPADSGPLERAPFQTLALSDLRLDLDVDGTHVRTGPVDADVFAERGLTFDLALRVGGAELTAKRAAGPNAEPGAEPGAEPNEEPNEAADEDVLCGLDLRLRYQPGQLLIRRLSLLALADLDPASGTRGDCQRSGETDLRRVALRLSQLNVTLPSEGAPEIEGRVFLRGPGPLVNRYVAMAPVHGWIGYSGDVHYDPSARLPTLSGQLSGADVGIDGFRLARYLDAEVRVADDVIELPSLRAGFADGDVHIEGTRIAPFEGGGTLEVPKLKVTGVKFPGLMRDLDVTPDTIVQWNIDDVLATDVRGTLSPFTLDGKLDARTDEFAVFDSAWHDAARATMVRAGQARIGGRFRADSDALQFYDTRVRFGSSDLFAKLVSIGFDNSLVLDVPEGAVIDLADIGPLGGLDVSGIAHLAVTMNGPAATAALNADLAVDQLVLAGFPVGDIKSSKARFEPLHVDFEDLVAVSGGSEIRLDRARLGFDGPASVSFDAHARSERLGIRDFLRVWNMADDPRYDGIEGVGSLSADVHYVLGGPEDRCASGVLAVDGRVTLDQLELFDERYAGAEADLHLHWWDMEAGDQGYDLRVPSLTLRKGSGAIVGSLEVRPGARLEGQLVASAVPLSSIDALGTYSRQWDGVLNGVARLGGTLDALDVTANVDVSPLRQGRTQLPASHLRVRFEPAAPPPAAGRSSCGHAIAPTFDLARHQRDESRGFVHVSGELWGGQIHLDDLRITQQRSKVVSGRLSLDRLDVGALIPSLPGWTDEGPGVDGHLSGQVTLGRLPLDRPAEAKVELIMSAMGVAAEGFRVDLASPRAKVLLTDGELTSQGLAWSVRTPTGQSGTFDLDLRVGRGQQLDATLSLRETSLGTLAPLLPGVDRAEGVVRAKVTAQGPLNDPKYAGSLEISGGRVFLQRLDSPVDSLELALGLDGSGFTIQKGSARIGGGTLRLTGGAPLVGTRLGRVSLGLQARDVALPLGEGIRVTIDSDLQAVHDPDRPGASEGGLPRVTGTVDVVSAEYRRPMSVTADLAALTARGKKTSVDGYDPTRDSLELDVLVRSKNPMRVENDLVEGELRIDSGGLRISGTDQRYGAVGAVQIVPGGRVRLRRNAFEIRQGIVRFNDPTRIAPQVDMTATTEYRRYDDPGRSEDAQVASSGTAGSSSLGGSWRIHLHAYGEPENLRVDLTSDPALAQDDIFLLLTVGLTRAELDQTRNAGLGSSVALEALGTLSGADQAVTDVVPVIDDFRFGSAYSTRTGRTEPTVTIGKRLSDRIRANVTTSLSDSSEVRSNLEWRMSPRMSIEGAYDNVKDIGSNSLGNVGGDVRWRLEFE